MAYMACVAVVVSTISACSGSPAPGETVTVTASATTAPSASASSSLAYPGSATESSITSGEFGTSPTPGAGAAESTGPPVLQNAGAPKSLTLTDIFDHDGWEEGLYQTPQSPTPQQGMATRLLCNSRSMEIRLAQATGKATVKVAQALDSQSSKMTMEFKLLADQRLVDTELVRFNQVGTLTTDLDGISAVELQVKTADGSEECYATAVITEFLLTPR